MVETIPRAAPPLSNKSTTSQLLQNQLDTAFLEKVIDQIDLNSSDESQAQPTQKTSSKSTTKPFLANMRGSPWFQCICHLKFDLQIGALIDTVFPQACLSDIEEKELCNLAFPESSGGPTPVNNTNNCSASQASSS